ncbi:MAG: ribonuclease HI, partial [Clostridia bacterium]|nr:ribonuclease HI [Clostridia bacterium]
WEILLAQLSRHRVEFVKVKGHADNEYNNRCDALARAEVEKLINNS